MNKDGIKLLATNELRSSLKENMPVSILSPTVGAQIVVSRYRDDVWDFYPYFPQDNLKSGEKVINWNARLPDGLTLTAAKHARLLESAKDFVWSLFADPIEGRKRPKMGTLVARFDVLVPLLRWMVSLEIDQFRQIDGRALDYISFASFNQKTGEVIAPPTLHYRLHMLECLFLQREKINDALHTHPWPHESSMSLSGVKRSTSYRRPSTQVIPDNVASKLARTAVSYIDDRYPAIKSAIQTCKQAGDEKFGSHRQTKTNARIAAAKHLGFTGMHEVMRLSLHLRTACYIVIDMFSGIRDSEMMSLDVDCISRSMSSDGSAEITWLHGTIFKTGVRAKKWLVPEVVARAVTVLTDLTAGLREDLNEQIPILKSHLAAASNLDNQKKSAKRLHEAYKQRNRLFLCKDIKHSSKISVISGQMINSNLKLFCTQHDIAENLGVPYQLHAHQFRRTYARFVARAELGDLLTLQDHFGHTSLDMTTYYLEGAADDFEVDAELLSMVNEEKNLRQGDIVKGYLLGDEPLANGMHWLKNWRSAVRTAPNKEELIAEYAGTLTLNGTGHSWCVGNAKGNGCGGLCIFEAQRCVDCHYGIIGQEHRPVWDGIRNQQLEVLRLDDIGPGGRAKALQILNQAEKVLNRLDGENEK